MWQIDINVSYAVIKTVFYSYWAQLLEIFEGMLVILYINLNVN